MYGRPCLVDSSHLHHESDWRTVPGMERTAFGSMTCPIARALDRVGEWWSILILRDALHGLTRFDQFQESLGIAPNMLSRRLKALVEAGMLEQRLYCERPPRHEYILTDRGREFRAVLVALYAWGSRHFSPEGASVLLVDAETGRVADPVLVDRTTGRSVLDPAFAFAPGPAATDAVRRRLAASPWGVATEAVEPAFKPPRRRTARKNP